MFDFYAEIPPYSPASWSENRAYSNIGEESPDFTEAWCRLMTGRGDPTESATENKPPMARQEIGGHR